MNPCLAITVYLAAAVASSTVLVTFAPKGFAGTIRSASNGKVDGDGSRKRDKDKSKSKQKGESSCPPDWMRETHGTGVQVGTGQPNGVRPIGCYEND